MATRRGGYATSVKGVTEEQKLEVECPHCHKTFDGEPIEGGRAARYLGFKCPHCRLFVPYDRVAEQALSRDTEAAEPA